MCVSVRITPHMQHDRRNNPRERRLRHWQTLWRSISSRRRAGVRRSKDPRHNILLDHHEPLFFFLIVATILLCVADAYLTLAILDRGGMEMNPFMRVLLETDVHIFFGVKYILTALCLILALTHKRFVVFRFLNGNHILWWTFASYAVLVNYEVLLLI